MHICKRSFVSLRTMLRIGLLRRSLPRKHSGQALLAMTLVETYHSSRGGKIVGGLSKPDMAAKKSRLKTAPTHYTIYGY